MDTHVDPWDDPRLEPYRDLKRTNRTRGIDWFIAEGRWVVRRLLESGHEVLSVVLSERAADSFRRHLPPGFEPIVLPHDDVSRLVGFQFHAGVIACGRRRRRIDLTGLPFLTRTGRSTVVACPQTVLPDNLGSVIRIAAALGADAVLVGPQAADPFSRRVIRVSMGNVFFLPILEPDDGLEMLDQLRHAYGYHVVAAARVPGAVMLPAPRPAERIVLLLGHEAHGLDDELLARADTRVEIPMSGPVDSLNVANAAAVLLYEFNIAAPRTPARRVSEESPRPEPQPDA